MSTTDKKNRIIMIIVLAVIFGMASGIVGELIARVYIFENAFNIPLFGDIDLSYNNNGGSNLIIRGAKKVIVEQDAKVDEAVNSLGGSMVGIFKKQATSSALTKADPELLIEDKINSSYRIKDELAQGFIITSDGWIITGFIPPELKVAGLSEKVYQKTKAGVVGRYVMITKDKKIYQVDDIIIDKLSFYSFWHIKANDLPVRRFAGANEVHNGQLVLAVNWDGWAHLATIVNISSDNSGIVKSSDNYTKEIILDQVPGQEFYGSYLFNLSGDLMGLINLDGVIESVDSFASSIKSVLKYREIRRASLGVNFIDLSELIDPIRQGEGSGALVAKDTNGIAASKDSAAMKAGFREGDIIIAVDNFEINQDNSLDSVINNYIAGDEIKIIYLRGKDRQEAKVLLQELK